ncbi:MAG: hypothetical protein Q6373_011475, partial [Candidatus Sigynarchaeota archaeon]
MNTTRAFDIIEMRQLGPFAGMLDSIKIHGAIMSVMARSFPADFPAYKASVAKGDVKFSSPLPVVGGKILVFKPILPIRPETARPPRVSAIQKMRDFKKHKFITIECAREAVGKLVFELSNVVRSSEAIKGSGAS